jgi:hypothetical protein
MMEDERAILLIEVLVEAQPWLCTREHALKRGLPLGQRFAPHVGPVELDQVEGPHVHVCVVVPVPDTIEGSDPIVTARHSLPVDDTGLRTQLAHRLDNEREALG